MTQNGIVIAVEGQNAQVEFERSEACAQCRLCQLGTSKQVSVTLPNRLGAKVGDTVCVDLQASRLLQTSAVAYLIPLLALLAGLWAGQALAPRLGFSQNAELFACAAGLVFVAITYLGIRLTEKRRSAKGQYAPKMLRILLAPETEKTP